MSQYAGFYNISKYMQIKREEYLLLGEDLGFNSLISDFFLSFFLTVSSGELNANPPILRQAKTINSETKIWIFRNTAD